MSWSSSFIEHWRYIGEKSCWQIESSNEAWIVNFWTLSYALAWSYAMVYSLSCFFLLRWRKSSKMLTAVDMHWLMHPSRRKARCALFKIVGDSNKILPSLSANIFKFLHNGDGAHFSDRVRERTVFFLESSRSLIFSMIWVWSPFHMQYWWDPAVIPR